MFFKINVILKPLIHRNGVKCTISQFSKNENSRKKLLKLIKFWFINQLDNILLFDVNLRLVSDLVYRLDNTNYNLKVSFTANVSGETREDIIENIQAFVSHISDPDDDGNYPLSLKIKSDIKEYLISSHIVNLDYKEIKPYL